MGRRVFIVGVGMIKFEKPGKRPWDYPQMAAVAAKKALADAGINYEEVQQATVGYVYGDSTCGQRAIYEVGLTGIPIYNVNNNCSTGSTALFMAKQFIEGGLSDCVLSLGFEKMERGSLGAKYTDRTNPIDKHMQVMLECREVQNAPFAPQMFGSAGLEHMEKYGTTANHFAKIAWKNHKHSVNNPYSQFRDEYSLDDILKSRKVFDPLTMLQCCPTSDGAAAAILASEDFVVKHNLQHQAVEIAGMALATDMRSSFDEKSCIKMVGFDMTKKAAQQVYEQAKLGPNDVQVVELHDCFSCNELVTYEGLGLCPVGEAAKLIDSGNTTYGGKWVINPSGGLISKGHPLGATGLAQCAELCWQLRQMCGKRQVPNCRAALQHNLGLGGAAVVALYKLGFPNAFQPYPADRFNPAIDERTDIIPGQETSDAKPTQQKNNNAGGFKSEPIFEALGKTISQDKTLVQKVGAIYEFVVNGEGGARRSWIVDLKTGPVGSVTSKPPAAGAPADCVVTIDDANLADMLQGRLDTQSAFLQGKLKISGNMALAMKLRSILPAKKAAL